jgi:L-fuconolactonase
VLDAHTHVSCADAGRFPPAPSPGVGSDWWQGGGGHVTALLAEMDDAGVDAAVVVQAVGVYGHDCRCAAATVAAAPERLSLVVSIDMDSEDPAAALAALVAAVEVPVAGVRLFGVAGDRPPWLADGRGDAVVAVAAAAGLTVVPCVFTPALEDLRRLASAHPEVPMALDHCAFPDRAPERGWRSVLALADVPSVALKVTTYVLEAAERDDGDAALALDRLVEAFGPDRLAWGSDHPQDRTTDYAGKVHLAARAARHLAPGDRDALFDATARRLFRARARA